MCAPTVFGTLVAVYHRFCLLQNECAVSWKVSRPISEVRRCIRCAEMRPNLSDSEIGGFPKHPLNDVEVEDGVAHSPLIMKCVEHKRQKCALLLLFACFSAVVLFNITWIFLYYLVARRMPQHQTQTTKAKVLSTSKRIFNLNSLTKFEFFE